MNAAKLSKLIPGLLLIVYLLVTLYQDTHTSSGGGDTAVGPSGVPGYVIEVLDYVEAEGKPLKNYVGGRTFQNREKRLPKKGENGKKLKYQEWDVHKKVKGKNRGAERLVTGSNGSAYYTKDHYKSFKQIK